LQVKEGHIVERNLRFSRNGPLISDALKLGKSIALRSSLATMDLATTSEAFLTLSNSHNIDEFIARVLIVIGNFSIVIALSILRISS